MVEHTAPPYVRSPAQGNMALDELKHFHSDFYYWREWIEKCITSLTTAHIIHDGTHTREHLRLARIVEAIQKDLAVHPGAQSMIPETMRVVAGYAMEDMTDGNGKEGNTDQSP